MLLILMKKLVSFSSCFQQFNELIAMMRTNVSIGPTVDDLNKHLDSHIFCSLNHLTDFRRHLDHEISYVQVNFILPIVDS